MIPIDPAPNPLDAKRQLPIVNTDPNPGFPPPTDPAADIGEQVAVEKALNIAAGRRCQGSNLKVIKSTLISYKEAGQQLPEPVEDHPRANTQVRLVEISGTFQRSRRPPQQGVPASPPTFTKAYIILRAADGLLLGYSLLGE